LIQRPAQDEVDRRAGDERWMREALKQALYAREDGEVPVGAVIVHRGRLIARAHNQRERLKDPTAHAEMIALTQAAAALDRWRLAGCTLYVTLEPCAMCAGAMVLARIDRVVYAAADPKAGACGSLMNLVQDPRLNHRVEVAAGVLAEEAGPLLRDFFQQRRADGQDGP
jgi:tRNA(adenine34) deaminase